MAIGGSSRRQAPYELADDAASNSPPGYGYEDSIDADKARAMPRGASRLEPLPRRRQFKPDSSRVCRSKAAAAAAAAESSTGRRRRRQGVRCRGRRRGDVAELPLARKLKGRHLADDRHWRVDRCV